MDVIPIPLFITGTLAFTALVVLVVAVIATVTGRRARGSETGPRTPEQRAQDRQTAKIWVAFLVLVLAALLMLYAITR